MSNLLIANKLVKNYGNYRALNEVSISIPRGSIFGLLGPNGAGKTSIIRIINQITMPDKGDVIFDGQPLKPNHMRHIGYLPEERGLYKSMKVSEQILYLAQLKGLSKHDAKKRIKYWFEKFEISNWYEKKIQELSKGMAQKIQFIVTVLHNPKLLIFDEPFSGFDPINANLIKNEILALREAGATIIFSTHRMESVEELCDNIALINKSNKILDGKLLDIKKQFKSNTFQIALNVDDKQLVRKKLSQQFEVFDVDSTTINEDLKIHIKLSEKKSQNDLISSLIQYGQLNHFAEIIPSINDIFIQQVQKN